VYIKQNGEFLLIIVSSETFVFNFPSV